MALLIAGFILFFGAHLSPGVFGLRQTLINRLGENLFRGVYIATSVLGMTGIIAGKAIAHYVGIYIPPLWAIPVVPVLMAIAFILLTALLIPSNIRRFTPHPMLWGIVFWSTGHLLANGDLASIIVFGGFGAYALISMWSLNKRGAQKSTTRYSPVRDILVVVTGLCICGLAVWLHPYVIGVPATLPYI
jgi:uncharacterized membrane protein